MCACKRDLNRNVKLRIILLYLFGAVLNFEVLDDVAYLRLIGYRCNFSAPFFAIGGQTHRRRLQDVLVPVTIRTLHGQKIKFVGFLDEPHRVGALATANTAGKRDANFVGVLQSLCKFREVHIYSCSTSKYFMT